MTQFAQTWVLAFTDAGTEQEPGSLLPLLLSLLVLGGIFYFLLILPQRRRMKALQEMRARVQVGDDIRTIGGIVGTVRTIDDEEFTLDVGGGTTLRMMRAAIADIVVNPGAGE